MKGFSSKTTEIAWHYTIRTWAPKILGDKFLKLEESQPGDKGLDEYPCVWFSKSEDYEPTALKFIVKDGKRVGRCKNAKQQAEEHGGLLRIGVDASRLHPLSHVIKRRGLLEELDGQLQASENPAIAENPGLWNHLGRRHHRLGRRAI